MNKKNIVIIPCVALLSKDFGTDYTKWDALTQIGKNAWESAVENVLGADEVVLFHANLHVKSHQEMERMILQKCLDLHEQGVNILLLEADTFCLKEVNLFNKGIDFLQLFSLAGTEDHPTIPAQFNLNSGVIYWPAEATKPKEIIRNELMSEWPATWAYYQNIWNKAFYSQFDSFEIGIKSLSNFGNGTFNWFYGNTPGQIQIDNAVIAHFFTSKGLTRAKKLSNITKKFGVRGFRGAIRLYNSPIVLISFIFKNRLIAKKNLVLQKLRKERNL